jgi:sialic acid synthase SpsE
MAQLATKGIGLSLTIEEVEKAVEQIKAYPNPKMVIVEIQIQYQGETKDFTLEEFKKLLGFE